MHNLGWRQAEPQEQEREAAEERRLWYVAATRVRDHLVIPALVPSEGKTKNTDEHWAVTTHLSLRLATRHPPMEGDVRQSRFRGIRVSLTS